MYKYYNHNPNNDIKNDCVCKAISNATNLNYDGVNNLLDLVSKTYRCEKLCVCCYHNLLDDILCYERVTCKNGETVEDIAKKYKRDTLIIRIEGHLTCSKKGNILDVWDCSKKLVDCFWFVV